MYSLVTKYYNNIFKVMPNIKFSCVNFEGFPFFFNKDVKIFFKKKSEVNLHKWNYNF